MGPGKVLSKPTSGGSTFDCARSGPCTAKPEAQDEPAMPSTIFPRWKTDVLDQ
jgi:hypothetical protein